MQEAMDESARFYKELVDTFLTHKDKIRSFGADNDAVIRSYIYGLEQWIYGHVAWYPETNRYFGQNVEEIMRTRRVQLRRELDAMN